MTRLPGRMMVLGAGRHQAPLIRRAEQQGIETIAVDYYEDSIGKRFSSSAVLADVLDFEAVLRAAREHDIDAITTVGTDQAMVVVATVAAELGLPCHLSPSGALAATNKTRMRETLGSSGVPMTVGHVITRESDPDVIDDIELPCVVKAADSQGQRGMQRINRRAELADAIELARAVSNTSTVVVEHFASGPELTINVWMRDGAPAIVIPVDRHTFNPTPAIGICLRHVAPSVYADRSDELTEIARRVAKGYGVTDGPLYIQLLISEGEFRVVEAASRVGGGHEAQLFEELHGLCLLDLTIDLAFGRNDRPLPTISNDRAGLVNFIVAHPGIVTTLHPFDESIEVGNSTRTSHGQWYVEEGYAQRPIVDSMGRIGAFVVTAHDRPTLMQRAADIYSTLRALNVDGENLVFWPDDDELNVASASEEQLR